MADPETPATNQGPVIISSSSSERAPIIYFDGASCFGHHNGAIQIELAANLLMPVGRRQGRRGPDRPSALQRGRSAGAARGPRQGAGDVQAGPAAAGGGNSDGDELRQTARDRMSIRSRSRSLSSHAPSASCRRSTCRARARSARRVATAGRHWPASRSPGCRVAGRALESPSVSRSPACRRDWRAE